MSDPVEQLIERLREMYRRPWEKPEDWARVRIEIGRAADALARLREEIAGLKARIAQMNKDAREAERDFQREALEIAAEAEWKARQGDEYGSY